jgi:glutamate-1-semialdehyde 2,1-aminomutase
VKSCNVIRESVAEGRTPPATLQSLGTAPVRVQQSAWKQLMDDYVSATAKSRMLHERISRSLAGGETRVITHFEPYPIAIASAEGPYLVDYDDNTYIDLVNNMASLVHGHRFPPIVRAVSEAFQVLGSVQAGSHRYLLDLSELLVERYSAFERVRFTNSASEAAILALRIARRATGRSRAIMFEGAYHGMGSEFTDPHPEMLKVPFNQPEALSEILDDQVAAVFAESFLGHAGVVPAEPEFLRTIQSLCERVGALFVLDETQSLRDDYGALHGALGLRPSLVLMGKSLGGGQPVGVLGGRAELVELASASRQYGLRHSGTFNGNVLTTAAGYQAMLALSDAAIRTLNSRAATLAGEIEAAGARLGLPIVVTRSGSTMCVHFADRAPTNAAEAAPRTQFARWFHIAALLEGVCVIRGGRLNLSTVLTDADMKAVTDALARALTRLVGIGAGSALSRAEPSLR